MAFTASELSVLAYANNFALWNYTTSDDSISAAGYFDTASDMLGENDLIIANVDTDGASPATGFYVVSSVADNAVSITAYA